jgi:putative restriction endonuclease
VGSGSIGGVTAQPVPSLLRLRQHQRAGVRSPHEPLLVLLALGRDAQAGSSKRPWSQAQTDLATLLEDFGPPSKTGASQAAAYPFTRLRVDGLWELDVDVPMDRVGALTEQNPTGRFRAAVEKALQDPAVLHATARAVVEGEFPATLIPDVLTAVGLDADAVYGTGVVSAITAAAQLVLGRHLWGRGTGSAPFCGFGGQLGSGSVGWRRHTCGGSTTRVLV